MANNVRKEIINSVKTALEGITTANSYQHEVKSVNLQLVPYENVTINSSPCLCIVDAGDTLIDEVKQDAAAYVRANMNLIIVGIIKVTEDLSDTFNEHQTDLRTCIFNMSLDDPGGTPSINVRHQRVPQGTAPDVEEIESNGLIYTTFLEIGYHYEKGDS